MAEVVVRGRYVQADGTHATGVVSFTPRSGGANTLTEEFRTTNTVRAVLDAQGAFEVSLLATDDPDWEPSGWTYLVHEDIDGVRPRRFYDIDVPVESADEGIDLADVAPVPAAAGTATAFVTLTAFEELADRVEAIEVAGPYDPAGAAATAQAAAISAASTDASTKASAAQTAAISAAASDATTKANNAQTAATSAASLDATTKANNAQAAAIAAAASDATTKANGAQAAAISTASADATTKANAAQAAAIAASAPLRAQLRGTRAVFLGDSVTIAQGNDQANGQWGVSFPTYASYLSKGRLIRVRNAGVVGNKAADMLARFDTDVTPYAPSVVVIMAGTNDWNDAGTTTLATYQQNIRDLVAKCRAISAQPILCTVPPNILSTARRQRTIIGNTWLRRYCADQAIPLADFHTLLTDPATGDYLTAYGSATNDKTHPIGAGYAAMGSYLATLLANSYPTPVDALLPAENGDPNNKLTNGLYLTTTGTGTSLMPTGWSVQSGVHPTGVTGSLVTGDAAIKGNWWKVVADGTASATNNEFQTVSGIVPGHVYAHVGRFKATGMRNTDTGNGSTFLLGCAFNSVLNNALYDFRVASTLAFDVADGTYYHEVVAPSDASTCLVRRQLLNTVAGAGTLQVAQTGFYDLTAMGLA